MTYNSESPDRGTAEVIIGKHRAGPVGTSRLAFLDHYTKFANMAKGILKLIVGTGGACSAGDPIGGAWSGKDTTISAACIATTVQPSVRLVLDVVNDDVLMCGSLPAGSVAALAPNGQAALLAAMARNSG